ncbi:unnamed protein product [Larinioides sclopetarius]|uniref:Uncharacterized protein n=1 Tax=Larinioides sclopetarius TaxID=280406 RepID=A0AAV2ANV3_9ARAC
MLSLSERERKGASLGLSGKLELLKYQLRIETYHILSVHSQPPDKVDALFASTVRRNPGLFGKVPAELLGSEVPVSVGGGRDSGVLPPPLSPAVLHRSARNPVATARSVFRQTPEKVKGNPPTIDFLTTPPSHSAMDTLATPPESRGNSLTASLPFLHKK